MKNKGKRRVFLYLRRKFKKILRGIRRKNKSKYKKKSYVLVENKYRPNSDEANKILKTLDGKNFGVLCQIKKDYEDCVKISIPSIFSISYNSEGVIKFLKTFYTTVRNPTVKEVYLDYSNCNELGLSASVVMDAIALAIDEYRFEKNIPLNWSGNLPKEKYACDIVRAGGLPYHIGAKIFGKSKVDSIEQFEMVKGSHNQQRKKAGIVATNLTIYLDRCLQTQKYKLNDFGKSIFSDMLGEVITNCEIHGGSDSMWYTQGYYKIIDEANIGEMQLVFLTIGDSIYEGLKKESNDETIQKLEHMKKMHAGYLSNSWNEETIYTVLALQEGISRLRTEKIKGYEFRGSGTVNLIEKFYTIGGTNNSNVEPKMSIISGHTRIEFSDKYKLKKKKFENDVIFGNTNSRIIAFNDENDIYKPADSNNVKYMKEYFPGTIISLKFYLDRNYIEKKKKG